MQQKKNIRLLIIWGVLFIITVAIGVYRPDVNKLDIDKDHFSLKEKINEIDKIVISSSLSSVLLQKERRKWSLNKTFTADPIKINDLLGVLSEVSVRRKVATSVYEKLNSAEVEKYSVTLFTNNKVIKSFEVAENAQGTLTYFIKNIAYVVNIPGYNYHLADIFNLPASDWRSPYVFASNWTTLDKMQISYPKNSAANFEIVYHNTGYVIPSINQLDTALMYSYMEEISSLQIQSYLPSAPDSISNPSDLNITVKDVGGQQIVLDIYIYQDLALAQINDEEWAIFDRNQVESLLKYPQDFDTE